MEQEEEDIELIEAYFNHTLSPEKVKTFDERIKADEAFAEKVDDYKDIIQGIRLKGIEEFKNEVATWEAEEMNNHSGGKQIPWKIYLSIAAAIALLLIAQLFLFSPDQAKNEHTLFVSYFSPYEDVLTVRDGNDENESLTQAMSLYNDHQYQEAIPYYELHLSKNPGDSDALFYLGISLLASHQTEPAINTFRGVIEQNNRYRDQAEWYLALTYLNSSQSEKAKTLLTTMASEPSHSLYEKATELLKELNAD